jgi:integrase
VGTITARNGGWRAQVRRKGHQPISRQFRTKAAAERWVRDTEDGIAAGTHKTAKGLSLADAIDKFEKETGELKPISRTKAGNLNALRMGTAGEVKLEDLQPAHIIAHANARTCGPATMAMELLFLGEVLEYARHAWGVKMGDPLKEARPVLRRAKRVGKSKERDRRLEGDEYERLHTYFLANKRMPMADLFAFAVASAMRQDEQMNLRWSELDTVKSLVLVRERKHPVTMKDEWVPLLPEARAIVDRQPKVDGEDRIFPYHKDSVGRAFRDACEQLGIADLTWHDLRHEGISRLFEAGYRIEQVALVSGHKDWRSLKRYTNLRPESLTMRPDAPKVGP